MVAAERKGGVAIDANLAGSIAKSKKFKSLDVDDEYDHDIGTTRAHYDMVHDIPCHDFDHGTAFDHGMTSTMS